MSRRDPGAAEGGIPREPGWCRCGHIEPARRIRADHSRLTHHLRQETTP